MVDKVIQMQGSRVQLDIGGHMFTTSKATLQQVPDTLLSSMFSGKYTLQPSNDGSYFIDRDGTHFLWILNFLRDPASIKLLTDKSILSKVLLEAKYYKIAPLVAVIDLKLHLQAVLHISNIDVYSPTDGEILKERPDLQVRTVANRHSVQWQYYNVTNVDAILVTVWSHINQVEYGNFLADFVDSGRNVVLCLFSNSANFTFPRGRFETENYHPLVPSSDRHSGSTLGKVYEPSHPVMTNVKAVSLGGETRRAFAEISTVGCVKRIADWADGYPMIAIRTDKMGIVTSITFSIGQHGGKEDAMKLVVNALSLQQA